MKVLIINGSPHEDGCTANALKKVEKELNNDGIETTWLHIGSDDIRGCIACNYCKENHQCVFNDSVNKASELFKDCEGIIIGSPVYYSGINGTVKSFLDRLFNSSYISKNMKVGAAIVTSRRAGSTSALSEIYKYYELSGMPIATSTYFNEIHDVKKDLEGIQTMHNLGKNMAFLIKSINLGKEAFGLPEKELGNVTNFVD